MRGYNQSEELAYTVAKILSRPYGKDTLRKTSFTKRQVKTTTKHQRINNQKNTFEVILPVGDGDFILIDDVTTTGATMLAARHALLSSGARTVTGVTVAH